MNAQLDINQHIRLMQHFARQVAARLAATGTHTTQLQDIVQELAIAWCRARDNWDETTGVPFTAYLKRGMIHHINRWAGKEIFHYNASHVELDAPARSVDDDSENHCRIADRNSGTPEDDLEYKMRRERALKKLTPRARQFVELIESPPECLVETVRGLAARRDFALQRGVRTTGAPKRVMASMVFRFMGCTAIEQTKITRELEEKFKIKSALRAIDGVN